MLYFSKTQKERSSLKNKKQTNKFITNNAIEIPKMYQTVDALRTK